MNIHAISINKLNLAPYNPRINLQSGDPEYEALKRSIEEFGAVEPIVWNQRTGNVVGGHQRLKVFKELGNTEIDCVVVDLDNAQEKALNLALNKIKGSWDDELLRDLLFDLSGEDIDISLTGFDSYEIEKLLKENEPKISSIGEIDTEDYADDEFKCECPRCGFRFNE